MERLALFLGALLFISIGLDAREHVAHAELTTLIAAREIQESGDPIFPTIMERPRVHKPPIAVWCAALTGERFARIVPAVVAALGVVGVSLYAGMLAAVLVMAFPIVLQYAHLASPDIWVFASLAWAAAFAERKNWYGVAIALAIGGLAKAPIVQIFFLLGWYGWRPLLAAGASLLPVALWALAVYLRDPAAVEIWHNEMWVYRFEKPDQVAGRENYFQLIPLMLPWVGLYACALFPRKGDRAWWRALRWGWLIVAACLVVKTPQVRYLLALAPAIALVISKFLRAYEEGHREPRWFYSGGHALWVLGVAVAIPIFSLLEAWPTPWLWLTPVGGILAWFVYRAMMARRIVAAIALTLSAMVCAMPAGYSVFGKKSRDRRPDPVAVARTSAALPAGRVFLHAKKIPGLRTHYLLNRKYDLSRFPPDQPFYPADATVLLQFHPRRNDNLEEFRARAEAAGLEVRFGRGFISRRGPYVAVTFQKKPPPPD